MSNYCSLILCQLFKIPMLSQCLPLSRRPCLPPVCHLSATCLPAAMTEFWLISAPGEKTCQQSWDKMMMATTHTTNLSTNNKFNIPDLKVTARMYSHTHTHIQTHKQTHTLVQSILQWSNALCHALNLSQYIAGIALHVLIYLPRLEH